MALVVLLSSGTHGTTAQPQESVPAGRAADRSVGTARPASERWYEETWRFRAPEARQGVAVDAAHFYAVGNTHIVKYERGTGARVAEWNGGRGEPLVHLNSCIVVSTDLVCAHSNYPGLPMVSSIEVWDTGTLGHRSSRSFGIYEGWVWLSS
jgi:hypothetical protein